MKKYPIVVKGGPVVPVASKQRGKPASRPHREPLVEIDGPVHGGAFLRFSYSYTEISSAGSTARVKSRRTAYENGRLASEQFEGELDRASYDRMIGEAERHFAGQAASLLRSLFPFLR